jgi:two-component system, NarL family, nitrate/nitrite response regulator NarL
VYSPPGTSPPAQEEKSVNEVVQTEVRLALLAPQHLLRDSLLRVLEGAGMSVVAHASEAGEFASMVDQTRPHVGVVDVEPPEEGVALVQQLHQAYPEVALLALVSDQAGGLANRCLEAGANGCLDKRHTGCESLIDAVRSIAQGASIFPASTFDTLLRSHSGSDHRIRVLAQLSTREREVLAYISAGADNLKIASHLGISERTVKAHVSALYRKLGQENRTQIALLARELGVRPPSGV